MNKFFEDTIYIKDLEIPAKHGVNDEEKNLARTFLVSIKIGLNFENINDDINKTVNYSAICQKVTNWMQQNSFNLLETCAEFMAKNLLQDYPEIISTEVEIKKPGVFLSKTLKYASTKVKRSWHNVFIGIGSNLGNKKENIDKALKLIQNENLKLIGVSKTYETAPVSDIPQDDYLNCAVEIKTLLSPAALMDFLLDTEKQLHRTREIKWGPRTIDLDILFYDNIICNNKKITIPHPRLHNRLFVLDPMSDLSPHFLHPILNKTILNLKENLEKEANYV